MPKTRQQAEETHVNMHETVVVNVLQEQSPVFRGSLPWNPLLNQENYSSWEDTENELSADRLYSSQWGFQSLFLCLFLKREVHFFPNLKTGTRDLASSRQGP